MIDVRKGGLREDGRHFDVSARRVWLYPTAEHQRAELLKPAYRHWIDLATASPGGESITIAGWADVTDVATITERRAPRRDRVEADLDRRVRGVAPEVEEARPALGPRAARAPPRRAGDRSVGRGLRRLHVVGRPRRPTRRPGVRAHRIPHSPTSRSSRSTRACARSLPAECWQELTADKPSRRSALRSSTFSVIASGTLERVPRAEPLLVREERVVGPEQHAVLQLRP